MLFLNTYIHTLLIIWKLDQLKTIFLLIKKCHRYPPFIGIITSELQVSGNLFFEIFIFVWCIVQEFNHNFLVRSSDVFEWWLGISTLIKEIKKYSSYSPKELGKAQLLFLSPSIPLKYLTETQVSSLISLILLSLLNVP